MTSAAAGRSGRPVPAPHRHAGRLLLLGGFAAVVAVTAALVEYTRGHAAGVAALAGLAALIAVGVAALALSLPGLDPRSLITGGFFVVAGVLSWTFIDSGWVVWAWLAVEGLVFAAWGVPWLRDAARLPRLGAAWLGLAYWILGAVGALLVWHPTVAAQRVAYAGVFGLAAIAVLRLVRRDGTDPTVGIAASFLLVIALLLLAGSGTAFQSVHPVPGGPQGSLWGSHMQGRFWGGPLLLYHPNSIGLIAVLAAIRIGAGRAFAAWQRLAAVAVAGLVLYLVISRTALLYAGVAAVLHAALLWLGHGAHLPTYRWRPVAAAIPLLVVGAVYAGLGGLSFATASRYTPAPPTSSSLSGPAAADPTSGRMDTWIEVGHQWRVAGWAEKALGDATTSRAVVRRGPNSPKLTTDNAAVGALRRGGVAGVAAFLAGLALLLWHALAGPRIRPGAPPGAPPDAAAGSGGGAAAGQRRGWLATRVEARLSRAAAGRLVPPAWFTIAAVGSVSTIVTADWLLGGTGGTMWIMLLAGEAVLVHQRRGEQRTPRTAPPGAGSRHRVNAQPAVG